MCFLSKILIEYSWGGAQDLYFNKHPRILLEQLACKYHHPSLDGGNFWKGPLKGPAEKVYSTSLRQILQKMSVFSTIQLFKCPNIFLLFMSTAAPSEVHLGIPFLNHLPVPRALILLGVPVKWRIVRVLSGIQSMLNTYGYMLYSDVPRAGRSGPPSLNTGTQEVRSHAAKQYPSVFSGLKSSWYNQKPAKLEYLPPLFLSHP